MTLGKDYSGSVVTGYVSSLKMAIMVSMAISATCTVGGEELAFKKLEGPPDSITEEFFKLGTIATAKVEGVLIQKIALEY